MDLRVRSSSTSYEVQVPTADGGFERRHGKRPGEPIEGDHKRIKIYDEKIIAIVSWLQNVQATEQRPTDVEPVEGFSMTEIKDEVLALPNAGNSVDTFNAQHVVEQTHVATAAEIERPSSSSATGIGPVASAIQPSLDLVLAESDISMAEEHNGNIGRAEIFSNQQVPGSIAAGPPELEALSVYSSTCVASVQGRPQGSFIHDAAGAGLFAPAAVPEGTVFGSRAPTLVGVDVDGSESGESEFFTADEGLDSVWGDANNANEFVMANEEVGAEATVDPVAAPAGGSTQGVSGFWRRFGCAIV
ncbi:hypothetical protein HDU96_000512 [Phlyctochytrium bullatum]|nr:hypothetical protein HDU96_000512 [Phlyctochytrium bullatum]